MWHNALTVHIQNLISAKFVLFNKSQFITNAQNVFHLIKTCMDTSDHGLSHSFERPGIVVNDLTSIKNAMVKCLFINWT